MTFSNRWPQSIMNLIVAFFLLSPAAAGVADELEAQRESYRQYAAEHEGDPLLGKQIYEQDEKLLCKKCHNIRGQELSGPNLEGIADKYSRDALIKHILKPSDSIKPGFEQVQVITKDGRIVTGRLERANQSIHRLIDSEGKQTDVPSDTIEEVAVSARSMMAENMYASITKAQFADLIAYLQTLKFGVNEGLLAGGRRIEIARLMPAIGFEALASDELQFQNPVWCGAFPGTPQDLAVIEHHTSRIWRIVRDEGPLRKELFLDLSGETHLSNNQGLMCMAFHPNYIKNRRYFLKYEVKEEGDVKTTVAERRAAPDGLRDSGQPSRRLLEIVQPAFNHNGGCLAFGPDGKLYTAFGDGGPQRDPPGYSQNLRVFHGSMLRIDVNTKSAGLPYGIPVDNPFLSAHREDPTIRPETWALGFREPWRFSFDAVTGELYLGDVGQDKYEEVCLVQRADNHGWNVREGYSGFSDEYRRENETYVDPILAYEHGLGFSVTGGHVYRGAAHPGWQGVYIFGDYNTRRVWGLRQRGGVVERVVEIGTAPGGIASFGVDQAGEIYVVTYMGIIARLDLGQTDFPDK